jgi:ATP phosphoribosyltransferase regulatory subunit
MCSVLIQKPYGVKDYLPKAAKIKRKTEDSMLKVFEKWGYSEVVTPSFEYLETFLQGNSFNLGERIFKFFDRQGRVLALRPDMTTPIARLAATSFKNQQGPLRLCYVSKVFRFEEPRAGRQREFHQAGAELIGVFGLDADAEVIALAVNALKNAGISEFKVNIGHFGFIEAVLDSIKADYDVKNRVKELLFNKDLVSLKNTIQNLSIKSEDKDLVERLFSRTLTGKDQLKEITDTSIGPGAKQALGELAALISVLADYEICDDHITIDLGLVRGLDYYTGVVFEIYSPYLGYPICGGGRYDRLIEKFDGPKAATGFGINMDGVLSILDKRDHIKENEQFDYVICYDLASRPLAIKKAMNYRNDGYSVLTMTETDINLAKDLAAKGKADRVVVLKEQGEASN